MTTAELFFYVVLPLCIAAGGAAIGYFYSRDGRTQRHHHTPAE